MSNEQISIIIEKGEPYEIHTRINLSSGQFLFGRAWNNHQPEIPFTNLYISKRHALLSVSAREVTITDLGSKHGTSINNYVLEAHHPYPLNSGDTINLAMGTASIIFKKIYTSDIENTVDFKTGLKGYDNTLPLIIKPRSREVLLNGKPIPLYGKELELLIMLYEKAGKAVNYDEIKIAIWPERLLSSDDHIPEVSNQEINALIYRIRKRLKPYSKCIVSVPRFGYRFDV